MMLPPKPFFRCAAALGAMIVAAAACSERGPLPLPVTEPAPASPNAAALRCTVAVRAGTLACEPLRADGSAARGVILGGQGTNVRLASSGTAYDSTFQLLSTDVTVQNLTAQPLGTTNGYTPAPDGVRVFFHQQPTVTAGSGTVTVANPDGHGTFTTAGQPYIQYSGALLPGDTSEARAWRFSFPPTVTTFVFTVFVYAPVPSEAGWVALSPIAPSLAVNDTIQMEATVSGVTGQPLPGLAVEWTTSDSTVARVNAAGRVTAAGPGSATITASSGARSGRVRVVVAAESETPPPTIVSFTLSPVNVAADGADTAWARVHVRSPVGIWQVWVGLIAQPQGNFVQCYALWESGTAEDGVFRCPLAIPAGATGGPWWGAVWASNPAQRGMSLSELRDAGAVSQVSVRSPNEDVTPPVVTGLAFAPDTVRPGDNVTVEVSFTDAGVGANHGGVTFSSGSAPNVLIGCNTSTPVAGTRHAGTFRCTFTVADAAQPGTWTARTQLIDDNINVGYTGPAELQAAGFPTELTVLPPDPP